MAFSSTARAITAVVLVASGCARAADPAVTKPTPNPGVTKPAPPPISRVSDAHVPEPIRPLAAVSFEWAFWPTNDRLLAASGRELFAFAPDGKGPVSTVTMGSPIVRVIATNGAKRFVVVTADGTETLMDADGSRPIATIPHEAGTSVSTGAISPDGSRVLLVGCFGRAKSRAAKAADGAPRCGALYDANTGAPIAAIDAKHDLDHVAFTPDGRFVVARSASAGITLFDAARGVAVLARPRWKRNLEVHAHNGSDIGELVGSTFIVAHDDTFEAFDVDARKIVARTTIPGKTLAALGRKTRRVAVMLGADDKVRVWDVATNRIVRSFSWSIAGANCTHCAVEIDETDEDRVLVTPAYNNERFELRVSTGAVKEIEHTFAPESIPSERHRLRETYDYKAGVAHCDLVRRDAVEPPRPIPREYCNRSGGPFDAVAHGWPYPGFDPSGRMLAAIYEGQILVLDVTGAKTVGTFGESRERRR